MLLSLNNKLNMIEVKHILPYLPYRLKVMVEDNIHELKGIHVNPDINTYYLMLDMKESILPFKLILRPLEDLSKYGEMNEHHINMLMGKNNDYGNVILDFNVDLDLLCVCKEGNSEFYLNFKTIEKFRDLLLSAHYDIFGLIDQGFAIDINTIQ